MTLAQRTRRMLDDARLAGLVPLRWTMTQAAWRAIWESRGSPFVPTLTVGDRGGQFLGLPVDLDDTLIDLAGDPLEVQLMSEERETSL